MTFLKHTCVYWYDIESFFSCVHFFPVYFSFKMCLFLLFYAHAWLIRTCNYWEILEIINEPVTEERILQMQIRSLILWEMDPESNSVSIFLMLFHPASAHSCGHPWGGQSSRSSAGHGSTVTVLALVVRYIYRIHLKRCKPQVVHYESCFSGIHTASETAWDTKGSWSCSREHLLSKCCWYFILEQKKRSWVSMSTCAFTITCHFNSKQKRKMQMD